jgi:hypothetical protein
MKTDKKRKLELAIMKMKGNTICERYEDCSHSSCPHIIEHQYENEDCSRQYCFIGELTKCI